MVGGYQVVLEIEEEFQTTSYGAMI